MIQPQDSHSNERTRMSRLYFRGLSPKTYPEFKVEFDRIRPKILKILSETAGGMPWVLTAVVRLADSAPEVGVVIPTEYVMRHQPASLAAGLKGIAIHSRIEIQMGELRFQYRAHVILNIMHLL
jgi:hypothetical protein